jgi:hypothetical protein
MNLLGLLGDIFKPAVELVDDLHTSEEEKLVHKASMLDTYAKALEAGLTHELEGLKARASIVEAEAKSEHWLTATWRPITMLTFVLLVVADQTGLLAFRLAEEAWTLLQLGLGGYVVGRSAEKVAPGIVSALKAKDET